MKTIKESFLLKFAKLFSHLSRQKIPNYRTEFFKHTFTQAQHIAFNCLKTRLWLSELTDQLQEIPHIKEALGLGRIPHFTSI